MSISKACALVSVSQLSTIAHVNRREGLLYQYNDINILRAENRNGHTIFLSQICNAHTFGPAHPTVSRSASLHIVDRHGAVLVDRPVVE
jgi:hypothetical protein